MGTVRLYSYNLTGTAELLDSTLTPLAESAFAPDVPAEVDILPGIYQLRLRLADGKAMRREVDLAAEGEVLVDLDAFWQRGAGQRELQEAASQLARRSDREDIDGSRRTDTPRRRGLPVRFHIRLFRGKGGALAGRARVEDSSQFHGMQAGVEHGALLAWLDFSPGAGTAYLHALSISATFPNGRRVFQTILVPPIYQSLSVLPDREQERLQIRHRVFAPPSPLQGMLDILSAMAPDAPDALLGAFYGVAEEDTVSDEEMIEEFAARLVQSKFRAPDLAAVAGFYLLRINRLELIRDWPRNLADYFPALPDGAVLEGWRRLLTEEKASNPPFPEWRLLNPPPATRWNPEPNKRPPEDPVEDAALRFVDAARRGPPRFAAGVPRLRAGLDWCGHALPPDRLPEGFKEAQQRARRWTAALAPAGALSGFAIRNPREFLGRMDLLERERLSVL